MAGDSPTRPPRPPPLTLPDDAPPRRAGGDGPSPARSSSAGGPGSALASAVASAAAAVVDPLRRAAAALTPGSGGGAGGTRAVPPRDELDPIRLAAAQASRLRRATLTTDEVEQIMARLGGGGSAGGAGGSAAPPAADGEAAGGKKRSTKRSDRATAPRVVPLGPSARLPPAVTNEVVTSKYNVATFLPLFLFEMFSRAAYLYFLLQAVLCWIPVVSPFGGLGSTAALLFVLAVAAVKAIFEDVKRHQQDAATNASVAHVVNADGSVTDVQWRDVRVGHVLRVHDDELFPADLVCLASGLDDGVCFVKTTNLDGENNLKIRRPVDIDGDGAAGAGGKPADVRALTGVLTVEAPNANLHHFAGRLAVTEEEGGAGGAPTTTPLPGRVVRTVPITINEVLLRGCMLKNTGHVIGVCVYTGSETRIQKNAAATPSKVGSYDRFLNFQIAFVMALQLAMCAGSAIAGAAWRELAGSARPALAARDPSEGNPRSPIAYAGLLFVTFWILYSYLVPISLFVTMEVVKFVQGFVFVNWDEEMRDPATGDYALARNTALIEDLGKVDYIFSDKTGTLTSNEMQLRQVAVKDVIYGDADWRLENWKDGWGDAAARAWDARAADAAAALVADAAWPAIAAAGGSAPDTLALPSSSSGGALVEEGKASPAKPRRAARSGPGAPPAPASDAALLGAHFADFWVNVCVCHSLIVEPPPGGVGDVVYQGPSPDEVALVAAARAFGAEFVGRRAGSVLVRLHGVDLAFDTIAVLEYSSARARMSVVARCPDGAVRVFTKGADARVLSLLRPTTPPALRAATDANLHTFATRGLRTLALGTRVLDREFAADWAARYRAAAALLDGRDAALDALAAEVEADLELVGVTAIEDKLQDGVPQAVATLLDAGARVWVITGDKQETAINIAVSCKLIRAPESLLILNAGSPAEAEVQLARVEAAVRARSAAAPPPAAVADGPALPTGAPLELVVDGATLSHMLGTKLEPRLGAMGAACAAVVVCRSSPSQKAAIVNMMRAHEATLASAGAANPVAAWYRRAMRRQAGRMLSVGDGANDVAMIQAADVGVGIIGKEGRQAVNSADFAVSQFRFLVRLLLVHGSLSAYRLSRLIKYSFYKNVAFGFVLFLYQFYCGFSGQSLVDDVSAAMYNVIFTSLPIFVFALFDRPVSRLRTMLAFPATYHPRSSLTTASFWKMGVGVAALDAVAALLIPLHATTPRGRAAALDVPSLGKTVFVALLACVTLEVSLVARFWTPLFAAAVALSFLLVFPFQLALQAVYATDSTQAGVASHLFKDPVFWLAIALCAAITFGVRYAERGGVWLLRPHDNMILEEMERVRGGSVHGGGEGGREGGDAAGSALPQWQTDARVGALGSRRRGSTRVGDDKAVAA